MSGFLAPWIVYALVVALHVVLPAHTVAGYVRDPETGKPPSYRINGALVCLVIVSAWMLACSRGWLASPEPPSESSSWSAETAPEGAGCWNPLAIPPSAPRTPS